jgi:hypothetical protein
VAGITEIHRRFESALPPDLLWVENASRERREAVMPGAIRTSDVQVGRHVPVSPGAVPRFLERWENVYSGLPKFETVLKLPLRIIVSCGYTPLLMVTDA